MIYHQDTQLTIHKGDALAVLQMMAAESVQTCVTSPPYFAMPPYYGIVRLWQTKVNSKKASDGENQLSSGKASTGDRASRIGIRSGSLLSTSKSSDQPERLRLKLDAQMRTFFSGSRSTRFGEEASIRREQLSIGALKAKQTQCTASAALQTTTGKADAHRSASLSICLKNGRERVLLYGDATRHAVSVAASRTHYLPLHSMFITSYLLR